MAHRHPLDAVYCDGERLAPFPAAETRHSHKSDAMGSYGVLASRSPAVI
jgi:hypothetical protein